MTQERKAAPENQTQRRIHKPEQTKGQAIETAVVSPISLLQRRQPLSPTAARALQRTIGNQALRRLTIQRKMSVGPVGDKYEQEADAVAKQVVSQLHNSKTHQTSQAATAQRQEDEELQMEPLVQRQEEEELQMKPFLQRQEDEEELQMKPLLQRQEEEEELQMKPLAQRQEEEELQAKRDPMLAGGELQGDVETAVAQAKSGGQSLNDAIRQPMEQAFNADFSRVKIHNGSTADHLNRSLSARAFTTGQDIFFRSGEYNPGSAAGQELIAHELTHTIQQGAAPRNNRLQPARQAATHKMAASQALLQRALMSANEFKEATGGSSWKHPRKRIAKIDKLLKKIEEKGPPDKIHLTKLLAVINNWLSVADEGSQRRPGTEALKRQVEADLLTAPDKNYGSDFSDFDSKQFRISGKEPNRKIEEVIRMVDKGKVEYFAIGEVKDYHGKAPIITLYDAPIPLGNWYPQVTHINGMAVAPKSGINSAEKLLDSVNAAINGRDDVGIKQKDIDILYTYSAQRGNPIVDVWDCIKGKVQVRDKATEKQEEIMLDAVHRQKRVTVSAHSRGTIKTDNAVRNVHKILTDEYYPTVKAESYEDALAYWKKNDPGIGLEPDMLAEMSMRPLAQEEAKKAMNAYIQLIYAGNAVQYPSAVLKFDMYVGGMDPISMFVGTYSEIGRKAHAAIGIGGSSDSKLHSVGKTKGHGFVGNYVPSVGAKIAEDLQKR